MEETHLTGNGNSLKEGAALIRENRVMDGVPLKRPNDNISADHSDLRTRQQATATTYSTPILSNCGFSHSKQNSFIPSSPVSMPTQRAPAAAGSGSGSGTSGTPVEFYCFADNVYSKVKILCSGVPEPV